MTSADATVLAAVTSVVGVIVSVTASLKAARDAVDGKLNELRQTQLGEIIEQRASCYPELWGLCLDNITRPNFRERRTEINDGWAAALSDSLENWHSRHGAFLSEGSYKALHRLRKRCRIFAERANTAVAARNPFGQQNPPKTPLEELDEICTNSFIDERDH
jgi:hypothetical protein